MATEDLAVREQLIQCMQGGHAHASVFDALKDFPASDHARKPPGAPHNAWQLLEHIRFTLHDLLDFCTDPNYSAPKWPEAYWPQLDAPQGRNEWDRSIAGVRDDLQSFAVLLRNPETDLNRRIPWGEKQTVLHEALLAIDHTSYHVGQLLMLRNQLDNWKG